MQTKQERTGWRDQALSERHREWGWNCPMIDIDFLACEYDKGKASAIIEYKNEKAAGVNLHHPSYRAIRGLADASNIPFFVCRYTSDLKSYIVISANDKAKTIITKTKKMSEYEYISFLYELRGRKVDAIVIAKFSEKA